MIMYWGFELLRKILFIVNKTAEREKERLFKFVLLPNKYPAVNLMDVSFYIFDKSRLLWDNHLRGATENKVKSLM